MRFVAIVAAVCLASPALAQTAAPAKPATAKPAAKPAAAKPKADAAKPVAAAPSAAQKSAYDAMSLEERVAIQTDLILVGDLKANPTGEWGSFSNAAAKAFQKRKGYKDTGILLPEERTVLAADAQAKQAEAGWRMVNDFSGARVNVPIKLAPQESRGKSGGHWQSARGEIQIDVFRETPPATLNALYEQMRKDPIRKPDYGILRPDFFVLQGLQGLKRFYIRAQSGQNEVRGIIVLYDQAVQGIMEPVTVAISSGFTAFPTTAQAAAGAPPKRLVEYGTGVVVSAAGHIVTDREAIDGCQIIVANGVGNAERVAEDRTAGLALLRVYGALDVKPLPLGDGARAEVSLVGIADPQAQGGNAAVSTVKVRVASANGAGSFEPAMTQGFAGAAAIDPDAGFSGVAVQRMTGAAATPSLVPVAAIRKLLSDQGVSFASGKVAADAAKDSVVRIICVRK
jgi:hypothetical protein